MEERIWFPAFLGQARFEKEYAQQQRVSCHLLGIVLLRSRLACQLVQTMRGHM